MSFNSGSHPPTLLALSSSSSMRASYGTRPKSVDDAAPEDPMQALVGRLRQVHTAHLWDVGSDTSSSASPGGWAINYLLLDLDTLIRFLREKRDQVNVKRDQVNVVENESSAPASFWRRPFQAEAKHKALLYGHKEWRDVQRKAVKLGVADLIVSFLPPLQSPSSSSTLQLLDKSASSSSSLRSSSSSSTPPAVLRTTEHRSTAIHEHMAAMESKLLELAYEFVAGGCLYAQNALYDAFLDAHDRVRAFLMMSMAARHRACDALVVLQQLCENHHTAWQAFVRGSETSFLAVSIRQLRDVYGRDVPVSLDDTYLVHALFAFFIEACQGPDEENQLQLASSRALSLFCDFAVHDVVYHIDVPLPVQRTLQRLASETLLAVLEGATAECIPNLLATALTADRVLTRLLADDAVLRSMATPTESDVFVAGVDLVHVVLRLTNGHLTPTDGVVLGASAIDSFRLDWDELETKWKAAGAMRRFRAPMVSVEVARRGTSFTVFFLLPTTASFFDKGLRKRFLDSMDLGADDALQVLTSHHAQELAQELRVMQWLQRHWLYARLGSWNWRLRQLMLYLSGYINFVLVLTLQYPSTAPTSSNVAAKTAAMDLILCVLGVGLVVLTSLLWAFHWVQTLCFSYAKHHITLAKLQLCSSQVITDRVWRAFRHVIFLLQLFASTFSIIVFLYSADDRATQVLGCGACLETTRSFFAAVRTATGMHRTLVADTGTYREMCGPRSVLASNLMFWYCVLYDTFFAGPVLLFGAYTLCAVLALQPFSWAYLFYGFPLLDILETNSRLNFIATAMRTNLGKLGVTAVFGAIVMYIFSLVGFFLLQDEMTSDDQVAHCSTFLSATRRRFATVCSRAVGLATTSRRRSTTSSSTTSRRGTLSGWSLTWRFSSLSSRFSST
ncbi:hypothetical protein SDRG_01078 [Saprolegnia diclina VS20]|uniref:RyR/IP3R Homology associated domain-containing protein n=1 Tax=Saprolegnia diclina (strain VS20) TaxID=1156394 RepID=T0QVI7_SAPDV|nr:hypothetical protein SDRG_01078 [Saprolegnia diclina VS20]EQC42244.1 hypothetical protein SDRG_01078 [Saprolegnia diclina VS20]|eukprot:XP_008604813.1 hypothetical protein SDRG_01078 [Saprolegnia diclina VS20]